MLHGNVGLFQAYLGLSDGEMSGEIEWKLDFSHSGLAVKKMTFKAESVAEDGGKITHVLTGDGVKVADSTHFGGKWLLGCLAFEGSYNLLSIHWEMYSWEVQSYM